MLANNTTQQLLGGLGETDRGTRIQLFYSVGNIHFKCEFSNENQLPPGGIVSSLALKVFSDEASAMFCGHDFHSSITRFEKEYL